MEASSLGCLAGTGLMALPFLEQAANVIGTMQDLNDGRAMAFASAREVLDSYGYKMNADINLTPQYIQQVVAPQFRYFMQADFVPTFNESAATSLVNQNADLESYASLAVAGYDAGLFRYADARSVVEGHQNYLLSQVAKAPDVPRKNLFYSKRAFVLRPLFYISIGASSVYAFGAEGLVIPVGTKILGEISMFFLNRMNNKKCEHILAKRSAILKDVEPSLEKASQRLERMNSAERVDSIPVPQPDRWEFREAYFHSIGLGGVRVIRSAQDLRSKLKNNHGVRYSVVELPEGGFEFRINEGIKPYHRQMLLTDRGEKIVGAGALRYDRIANVLFLDGSSSEFMTARDRVKNFSMPLIENATADEGGLSRVKDYLDSIFKGVVKVKI